MTSDVAVGRASARRRRAGPRGPYRKAEEVRGLLLAATVELLAEKPPSRITVRDIGGRAGMQHSLVARHFGSKDNLLAEALHGLTDAYTADVAGADGPVDGFLRGLDHLRDNPTGTMAMAAGASARSGTGSADRFPGFAAHLDQLLEAGAPDDDHTRLVAGLAVALVAGWSVLEPNVRDASDLDLPPDVVRRQVADVLDGLFTRELGLAGAG